MAKRSRRARRRAARRATATPGIVSARAEEQAVKTAAPTKPTSVDFAGQYDYVYGDLKRIAILAGTMFAILILLSFVIG